MLLKKAPSKEMVSGFSALYPLLTMNLSRLLRFKLFIKLSKILKPTFTNVTVVIV